MLHPFPEIEKQPVEQAGAQTALWSGAENKCAHVLLYSRRLPQEQPVDS